MRSTIDFGAFDPSTEYVDPNKKALDDAARMLKKHDELMMKVRGTTPRVSVRRNYDSMVPVERTPVYVKPVL